MDDILFEFPKEGSPDVHAWNLLGLQFLKNRKSPTEKQSSSSDTLHSQIEQDSSTDENIPLEDNNTENSH